MALKVCRECGAHVSSEAGKCPSCGIEEPWKGRHQLRMFIGAATCILSFLVVSYLLKKHQETDNQAECSIAQHTISDDVFYVQDKPDVGYRVDFAIKNVGEQGEIKTTVKLSTSEGEFSRSQTLVFSKNQEMMLSFNFHEPTVNVRNVQSRIFCWPSQKEKSEKQNQKELDNKKLELKEFHFESFKLQ